MLLPLTPKYPQRTTNFPFIGDFSLRPEAIHFYCNFTMLTSIGGGCKSAVLLSSFYSKQQQMSRSSILMGSSYVSSLLCIVRVSFAGTIGSTWTRDNQHIAVGFPLNNILYVVLRYTYRSLSSYDRRATGVSSFSR